MGTKMDTIGKIAVIAFVLVGIGMILPSDVTEEETKCSTGEEYCHPSEKVTVTEEKDNPWKVPLMVGGVVVFISAYALYDSDDS